MDSLLEPEDQLRERYLSAPWGDIGRSATLGVVALVSKVVLRVINSFQVDDLDVFYDHVLRREDGVGLITVSNHTSTLDDPMLFSAMLPWSFFFTEHLHHKTRWSLCAREMCYRNAALAAFFKSGKTLPIERGAGPGQAVMRVAAGEVARGGWLHVFPEGRVSYSGTLGPLRWGVGKIFCDAVAASARPPTVLPFSHSGMGRVLPRQGRVPRVGRHVAVAVGPPIPMHDLAARCGQGDVEQQRCVWREVTDRIAAALVALEARLPPNVAQPPRRRGRDDAGKASEGALPVTAGES